MKLEDLQQYINEAQPLPGGSPTFPGENPPGPKAGLYFGTEDKQYFAFRGLNASLIKEPTPAEMWHTMNEPARDKYGSDSEAEKWTVGTLVHWAVLEPWRFRDMNSHCIISPTKGLATQRAQAVREAYPDQLVVAPEHIAQAARCRAAIESCPEACEFLAADGANEVTLVHWDKPTSFWYKGRFDRVPRSGNYLLDVKSTAFPLPQFPREIKKLGYHIQAAWYLDLWEAVTGERKERFIWVAVTKSEPYMCRLFDVYNWPVNHIMYRDSPLKAAREIIDARRGPFITSVHETLAALRAGLDLDYGLTRSLWPGYEHIPVTPVIFT